MQARKNPPLCWTGTRRAHPELLDGGGCCQRTAIGLGVNSSHYRHLCGRGRQCHLLAVGPDAAGMSANDSGRAILPYAADQRAAGEPARADALIAT